MSDRPPEPGSSGKEVPQTWRADLRRLAKVAWDKVTRREQALYARTALGLEDLPTMGPGAPILQRRRLTGSPPTWYAHPRPVSLEPTCCVLVIGRYENFLRCGDGLRWNCGPLPSPVIWMVYGYSYLGTRADVSFRMIVGISGRVYSEWNPPRKKAGWSFAAAPVIVTPNEDASVEIRNLGLKPVRFRARLWVTVGKQIG